MAAKLLMKRFAIKDVSESLASFVIKYLNIVHCSFTQEMAEMATDIIYLQS